MNRTAAWLLLVLALLTGCATKVEWVQEGKSDAETQRDYKECYAQTKQRYGTDLESPHFTADLNQCMESRGYKRKIKTDEEAATQGGLSYMGAELNVSPAGSATSESTLPNGFSLKVSQPPF